MQPKLTLLISVFFSFFILTGCGSSSPVSTGVYKDAGVVSGLQYQTATQSGVTDAQGRFKYLDGEKVTFSVSNVTLGQATGAAVLTTFDLVGITPPTSSLGIPYNNPKSKKFQEALNISIFLQTLDEDGNTSNGIHIPALLHSVVATKPMNFKLVYGTPAYGYLVPFAESPQLKMFLGKCRTAGVWGGTKAIKKIGPAAAALYSALGLTPKVDLIHVNSNSDGSSVRYEYDRFGQITGRYQYNTEGVMTSQRSFGYDSNGNWTDSVDTDPSTSLTYSSKSIFDDNGNWVSLLITTPTLTYRSVYTYDINGNLVQQVNYTGDEVTGKYLFTYSTHGTLSTEKRYDAANQLYETTEYTYTSDLLIESYIYTNNITGDTYSYSNEYDADNNIIKNKVTSSTNETITLYTYDSFGNPVDYLFYTNGALTSKSTSSWGTDGLYLGYKNYDGNLQLQESETITYDGNGNILQRVGRSGSDAVSYTHTNSYVQQSGWSALLVNYFRTPT